MSAGVVSLDAGAVGADVVATGVPGVRDVAREQGAVAALVALAAVLPVAVLPGECVLLPDDVAPPPGSVLLGEVVSDAGPLLERLHRLTRSDSTTRNQRKAARLKAAYDSLEDRIATLREAEELAAIRPDLDGTQIMDVLGIRPGRDVGEAYRYLLDQRLEHGPLGEERAREVLLAWWEQRSS